MDFSRCIPVGTACKTLEQQGGNSGRQKGYMARDFGLISLRLADLGREDSSAGETE